MTKPLIVSPQPSVAQILHVKWHGGGSFWAIVHHMDMPFRHEHIDVQVVSGMRFVRFERGMICGKRAIEPLCACVCYAQAPHQ